MEVVSLYHHSKITLMFAIDCRVMRSNSDSIIHSSLLLTKFTLTSVLHPLQMPSHGYLVGSDAGCQFGQHSFQMFTKLKHHSSFNIARGKAPSYLERLFCGELVLENKEGYGYVNWPHIFV